MVPRSIAFLRAINVGGHTIKMDRLRTIFESLGFTDVETFIASGNVIFRSPSKNLPVLEKKIETKLQSVLGYEVATFIRSDSELIRIAEYKPFRASDLNDESNLVYIAFLATPPDMEAQRKLMAFRSRRDDFHVHEREVYWLCRKKMTESEFSGSILEKTLGMRATIRNSTTVRKLAEKYRSLA